MSNTTGMSNSAFGVWALYSNTTGWNNTALGDAALQQNTGNANTASGALSLSENTTGSYNTASGNQSLSQNTTGYNNTAFGSDAGGAIFTGNKNTFLGYGAGDVTSLQKGDAVNSMALGYGTYTTADNQVVIGNLDVTQTILRGNVSVGGNLTVTGSITGGGMAVREPTCAWSAIDSGGALGSCTPASCQPGFTDAGISCEANGITGDFAASTGNFRQSTVGSCKRICYMIGSGGETSVKPTCAWNSIDSGGALGSCTPNSCPSGFTDGGVGCKANGIIGAFACSTCNFRQSTVGSCERICSK
jgi:hypothetical protein